MNADSPALRVSALRKSFGRPAVDGLDLTVRRGELYALLGPNGAGKTTTLRMVTGLLAPDEGRVEVLGIDIARDPAGAKRGMAYLPDDPLLYGKLKPTEYLEFVAGLWGIRAEDAEPRARRLLDWLDLTRHAHELTEGFSRGMKQKLALAGALIHEPELLILGGTVILTTHILEVAERLAQRIGIIRQGRLIAEGTLAELRERTHGGSLEDVFLHLTEGHAS
jgi:ABC-2 type transport system ATP-binding protein